jgi:hypothetical protein
MDDYDFEEMMALEAEMHQEHEHEEEPLPELMDEDVSISPSAVSAAETVARADNIVANSESTKYSLGNNKVKDVSAVLNNEFASKY